MNINHIIITGNLVANPALRETNTGTRVATATIANNEFFSDGQGDRQQVTTFVDVTVWGSPERTSCLSLKRARRSSSKGNFVVTTGSPRTAETFQALPESRKLAVHSK